MNNLSTEYLLLFNSISEALEQLEEIKAGLMTAQQKAEELYIEKSA